MIVAYVSVTKNLAYHFLVKIAVIGIAYPCMTIIIKKALFTAMRRDILRSLNLHNDKKANISLFSMIALTLGTAIAIPGFFALGALVKPQTFLLAVASTFTTELIVCYLYIGKIRPVKDNIKRSISMRLSGSRVSSAILKNTDQDKEAEDEDHFLAIQYAYENFGERVALLSALLLAGTIESNPLALLYRIPITYACKEVTDLIRGIICRNHGIYLPHIKILFNWNDVSMLVCCILCISCAVLTGLGVAEFAAVVVTP